MGDRSIGALAIAAWVGALVPIGNSSLLPLAPVVAAVVALRVRSALLLVASAALIASFGAGAAWAESPVVTDMQYEGVASLVSDPTPVTGGVRVMAEIEGQRYDLRAWGSPAGWLRNRLMGEQVDLEARLRPLGDAPAWMRARGLVGRGTVTDVSGFDVGQPHTRLANSVRRTIESGARSLDRDELALFAGLVYGDDRAQSPLTADNFQAAGLSHLLAVSGQNVAFALAIVGPMLRRLGYRGRFVLVFAVLLLFATVTRFEPSVIRASVMTSVAAVAALLGTEVSSQRILSLAVTVVVLVEPLIVHSVAFQLSVAASAGILFWSGRVARAVPGPRWFAESLAVTSTAQLAVAPLLVWHFDGLPVASLPANLLAGPAAGPTMMWGLTGGLIAGLCPPWVSALLHVPTKLAVWWIDSVAAASPGLGLGSLGAAHIVVLFAAGRFGLRQHARRRRMAAAVVVAAALLHPALVIAISTPTSERIDGSTIVWRDEARTVLELDPASRPESVLAGLRNHNVGAIDVLVAHNDSRVAATMIGWIKTRHDIGVIWAPGRSLGHGEQIPDHRAQLNLECLTLTANFTADTLNLTPTPTCPR